MVCQLLILLPSVHVQPLALPCDRSYFTSGLVPDTDCDAPSHAPSLGRESRSWVGQGQVLSADARPVGYKSGSRLLRICVSGSRGSPCPALLRGQEWVLRCKAFLGEWGWVLGAQPSLEPLHLWPGEV